MSVLPDGGKGRKSVGKVAKMLCDLGHEPTVMALGGPPCPNPQYNSFSRSNNCWEHKAGKDWLNVSNKLISVGWGREILVGLGQQAHCAWELNRNLDNPQVRMGVIEGILRQADNKHRGFDKGTIPIPGDPAVVNVFGNPEPEQPGQQQPEQQTEANVPDWSITTKTFMRKVIRAAKNLKADLESTYRQKVKDAEARKRAWLAPLMWEALYNEQYHRRDRQKKRDFYRKAKNTACFDCDQQQRASEMNYDHLRDKSFTLGRLNEYNSWDLPWRQLHLEIGKCDVVCRDCHDVREYLRGIFHWDELRLDLQQRVEAMEYMERRIYYQVIVRETERAPAVDAETLRRLRLRWERYREAMGWGSRILDKGLNVSSASGLDASDVSVPGEGVSGEVLVDEDQRSTFDAGNAENTEDENNEPAATQAHQS